MRSCLPEVPLAPLVVALLAACSMGSCAGPTKAPYERPSETSVKPGINDGFLAEDLDVGSYVERFEGESREVFAQRAAIVDAIGLTLGAEVADVGAGTGPFLGPLADAVGAGGKVFALDIAPRFVEHLARRAAESGYSQVEARQCREDSVDLPQDSLDVAFLCDVYHHFEFPESSIGSLHHALRQNGEIVIVDFERIPGVSREWTLEHVRAGKAEVVAELDGFGFDLIEELQVNGLEENWVGRFRKR